MEAGQTQVVQLGTATRAAGSKSCVRVCVCVCVCVLSGLWNNPSLPPVYCHCHCLCLKRWRQTPQSVGQEEHIHPFHKGMFSFIPSHNAPYSVPLRAFASCEDKMKSLPRLSSPPPPCFSKRLCSSTLPRPHNQPPGVPHHHLLDSTSHLICHPSLIQSAVG